MRKNELIKLLEEIEGNPEVVLWNGFVQDWQHIDKDNILHTCLYKESKEHIEKMLTFEVIRDTGRKPTEEEQNELKSIAANSFLKEYSWHLDDCYDPVLTDEEKKSRYGNNIRKVLVLQPKIKGEEYFDRLGAMSY